MDDYAFDGIDVSGEATGYLWLPFFLQLAADPELRDKLGTEGGAFARERFDAVRIFDEMETFFTEVAAKGKHGESEP